MTYDENHKTKDRDGLIMSDLEFALLGGGEVGYIREISGKRAAELFGIKSEISADQVYYTLHGADGTCMALADSREAVIADAFERHIEAVSVH